MNSGPSETIEVEALLATSVLDADNVPNKNQSTSCFSCDAEMVGLYCKDCGQKNDDFRRSIFALIKEAFTSVFSLESRMWKTWWSLLTRPGKTAREYADGRRAVWTSPVRIYLAMSIILFGYLSLTDTRIISVRTDIQARDGYVGNPAELTDNQVRLSPQFLFFARQSKLDKLNENLDFARVESLVEGPLYAKFSLDKDDKLEDLADEFEDRASNLETEEWLNYALLGATSSEFLSDSIIEQIDEELAELAEERNEGDGLSPLEMQQKAVELAIKKQERAITRFNRLLRVYPEGPSLAQGLSEKTLPFSETTMIEALPDNLTPEKRTELETEIRDVLTEMKRNGLDETTISEIHLDTQNRSAWSINTVTLNGKTLDSKAIQRLTMTVLRQPEVLNRGFSTYLPRVMFFMMPFAMFAGVIFIRGKKNALMFDHLVHAAYIHAVAFLFLFVLILLSQMTGITGLGKIFFWGMVIYLPISARYMFKRGWFKTLLMSYFIGFQYSLLMFLIMTGLLATQLNQTVTSV